MGTRYRDRCTLRRHALIYEAAANLAREHDLLEPLALALINLAAILNSRDLPAAMNYARDAHDVARRCG